MLAGIITGFGRAIGEVGAAMMLGNIQDSTRPMTTAIALELGKGDFELGLALGLLQQEPFLRPVAIKPGDIPG